MDHPSDLVHITDPADPLLAGTGAYMGALGAGQKKTNNRNNPKLLRRALAGRGSTGSWAKARSRQAQLHD